MSKKEEPKQVFLGGACGLTTWRKDIAIPLFEAAGVTYHNPQMPLGAWKEDDQFDEMRRKDECLVQLFVMNGDTRGVASVAEVAYLIGARKAVSIVLEDVKPDSEIYGAKIGSVEADDLNRGRIYVRAMADRHGVPVYTDIAEGTRDCIRLVKSLEKSLTLGQIEKALADVKYKDCSFNAEEVAGGFHLWITGLEDDTYSGQRELQQGRKWFVSQHCKKSDVIRTAFKAVSTWAEHEAREAFQYKDVRVFSPHLNVDQLVSQEKKTHTLEEKPESKSSSQPCSV
jgi:hypothetical protein